MSQLTPENAQQIFYEMMVHPALFAHLNPQKLLLITSQQGILDEALKHETVKEILTSEPSSSDERVKTLDPNTIQENSIDIIISTAEFSQDSTRAYLKALHSSGIFVQLTESPFSVLTLKNTKTCLTELGFSDVMVLTFPQPYYPTGLRCAFLAKKTGIFKKIREKDIYNKNFQTLYYNFDIHKSALVLPEFLRAELEKEAT